MDDQAKFFHAFNLIDGIGPQSFKKLIWHFKNLKTAWLAPISEFENIGLTRPMIENISDRRAKINPDQEFENVIQQDIEIITIEDKSYPKLLKEIYDPPALLYVKGQFQKEDEFSLAIVGTRKLTVYGQQVTPIITADLSRAGLTIVSGLARGIDTLAHKAALEAGGRTIAVLGSGLDDRCIYPSENLALAQRISQQGAVISEFPPRTKSLPQYFPLRNRIISGLSLGTLVIEAPQKSGALITARESLEQNREVFAIPGSIFSQNSTGNNDLIKMGAKLITCVNDILEELNLTALTDKIKDRQIQPANPQEALILNQLSNQPLHIDKIILNTKLTPSVVNSNLTLMEIKGKVRNLGNNNFVLGY